MLRCRSGGGQREKVGGERACSSRYSTTIASYAPSIHAGGVASLPRFSRQAATIACLSSAQVEAAAVGTARLNVPLSRLMLTLHFAPARGLPE